MKNTLLLSLSVFISTSVFGQVVPFDTLLARGKAEFYKDFDKQNYSTAIENLEQAVNLKPSDPEAHYFLGYAYSRIDGKDGRGMIDTHINQTLKTSEQFEEVIRLSPKYEGEIVSLDPYSKITSEWGSLAMSYLYKNKLDSANWAFKEGKQRGGFSDFYLSINRSALDICSTNSYLISSGDNFTIVLWYLQTVEKYRTDVTVVDVSLLNSIWYPNYLENNTDIKFNFEQDPLDSINYCKWSDSTIAIPYNKKDSFSWVLKPSYYEEYLLRGDRLLLKLLEKNQFKKEVFFTLGFNPNSWLSLDNNIKRMILVSRLNYNEQDELTYSQYKSQLAPVTDSFKYQNRNSKLEETFAINIRADMYFRVIKCVENGEKKQAEKMFRLIDSELSPSEYPFTSLESKKYHELIKAKIYAAD